MVLSEVSRVQQPLLCQISSQRARHYFGGVQDPHLTPVKLIDLFLYQRVVRASENESLDVLQLGIRQVLGNYLVTDLVVEKPFLDHGCKERCGKGVQANIAIGLLDLSSINT